MIHLDVPRIFAALVVQLVETLGTRLYNLSDDRVANHRENYLRFYVHRVSADDKMISFVTDEHTGGTGALQRIQYLLHFIKLLFNVDFFHNSFFLKAQGRAGTLDPEPLNIPELKSSLLIIPRLGVHVRAVLAVVGDYLTFHILVVPSALKSTSILAPFFSRMISHALSWMNCEAERFISFI